MPKSFYNFARISSFNATYNMVVGGRGIGKTYGRKQKAIRDSIRKGKLFIYLRRFKPELLVSKETFFADVESSFPDYDFKVQGFTAMYARVSSRGTKKREWTVLGYFIALSTVQSFKSASFERVTTIIFDEFIIEKGLTHYLPQEVTILNNFYSTVDRYKDKTKIWFLANSVSITNPYFIEWKIEPRSADKDGFIVKANGFMVIHLPDSEEFKKEIGQTKFGQFIEGTEYADYAVNNQFADDGEALIKSKAPNAKYMCTLETKDGTFSVWHDIDTNLWYCGTKRTGNERMFTLIPERMNDTKTLLVRNDKFLQMLRTAFNHARLWFDNSQTRNAFLEVFK